MFRVFWMVLGDSTPNYRHMSEASAKTEAERLARAHPGKEFYVLCAIGKCVKSDIAWSDPTDDDAIPF